MIKKERGIRRRRLDFGSGHKGSRDFNGNRLKGKWETADISGADHNFDFNEFPYPFKDNTFDEIVAMSSINHLDDFFKVMNELYRIAKPNALIKIAGSFWNCCNAFLPTHKILFTYAIFDYLCDSPNSPEMESKIKSNFELIEFYTEAGIFGKWIPDLRFSKRKVGLRYLIGMMLGDVVVCLKVTLKMIK